MECLLAAHACLGRFEQISGGVRSQLTREMRGCFCPADRFALFCTARQLFFFSACNGAPPQSLPALYKWPLLDRSVVVYRWLLKCFGRDLFRFFVLLLFLFWAHSSVKPVKPAGLHRMELHRLVFSPHEPLLSPSTYVCCCFSSSAGAAVVALHSRLLVLEVIAW